MPNRNTAVATPRRQPRRARKLTPGSMARERNSETTIRNSRVWRREKSHRPTSVAKKPSQNTMTARSTQRGMVAVPADGSTHGVSDTSSGSSGSGSTGTAAGTARGTDSGGMCGSSATAVERRCAARFLPVTTGDPRADQTDAARSRQRTPRAPGLATKTPARATWPWSRCAKSWPRPSGPASAGRRGGPRPGAVRFGRPEVVRAGPSRAGGCTRTPRSSSERSEPCFSRASTHWPWRVSPTTRTSGTTRGAAYSAPLGSWPPPPTARSAQAEQACATVRRVHDRVHGVAAGRAPVRRQRPPSPHLGPCRRGRQLPRRPPALRRSPPRRHRAGRLRGGRSHGRRGPGGARSAAVIGRAQGVPGRLPPRAGGYQVGPRRRPLLVAATAGAAGGPRPVRPSRCYGGVPPSLVGEGRCCASHRCR